MIGTDGRVQHAEIVTGNPALVQSALDSINKWRYCPAVLNSSPVEIFTTVDLEYRLTQQVVVRGPPIDPILRADIGKLLDMTDAEEQEARKLMGMIRGRLFRSIGDEIERKKWIDLYEQKLIKNFKTDQYRDWLIEVYARNLSNDDVRALIAFCETPSGRRVFEKMPQISASREDLRQRVPAQRLPKLTQQVCGENAETGHKETGMPRA
jgi:hypothetical protein